MWVKGAGGNLAHYELGHKFPKMQLNALHNPDLPDGISLKSCRCKGIEQNIFENIRIKCTGLSRCQMNGVV
jgi:hypothetical protein